MYNTFKPEQPMGLMDFVRAAKACITEITPGELLEKRRARIRHFGVFGEA